MAAGIGDPMGAGMMADKNPGMGRQAGSWSVLALQERGPDVSHMWEEGTHQSGLLSQEGHQEALTRQRSQI